MNDVLFRKKVAEALLAAGKDRFTVLAAFGEIVGWSRQSLAIFIRTQQGAEEKVRAIAQELRARGFLTDGQGAEQNAKVVWDVCPGCGAMTPYHIEHRVLHRCAYCGEPLLTECPRCQASNMAIRSHCADCEQRLHEEIFADQSYAAEPPAEYVTKSSKKEGKTSGRKAGNK